MIKTKRKNHSNLDTSITYNPCEGKIGSIPSTTTNKSVNMKELSCSMNKRTKTFSQEQDAGKRNMVSMECLDRKYYIDQNKKKKNQVGLTLKQQQKKKTINKELLNKQSKTESQKEEFKQICDQPLNQQELRLQQKEHAILQLQMDFQQRVEKLDKNLLNSMLAQQEQQTISIINPVDNIQRYLIQQNQRNLIQSTEQSISNQIKHLDQIKSNNNMFLHPCDISQSPRRANQLDSGLITNQNQGLYGISQISFTPSQYSIQGNNSLNSSHLGCFSSSSSPLNATVNAFNGRKDRPCSENAVDNHSNRISRRQESSFSVRQGDRSCETMIQATETNKREGSPQQRKLIQTTKTNKREGSPQQRKLIQTTETTKREGSPSERKLIQTTETTKRVGCPQERKLKQTTESNKREGSPQERKLIQITETNKREGSPLERKQQIKHQQIPTYNVEHNLDNQYDGWKSCQNRQNDFGLELDGFNELSSKKQYLNWQTSKSLKRRSESLGKTWHTGNIQKEDTYGNQQKITINKQNEKSGGQGIRLVDKLQEQKVDERESQLQFLENEIGLKERFLRERKEQMADLDKSVGEKKEFIRRYTEKYEVLREDSALAKSELAEANKELERIQGERKKEQETTKKLQGDSTELASRIVALKEELIRLECNISNKRFIESSLENDLARKSSSLQEVETVLDAFQKEKEKQKQADKEMREYAEQIQRELKMVQQRESEAQNLHALALSMRDELICKENQLMRRQEDLQRLQVHLELQQKEHNELQSSLIEEKTRFQRETKQFEEQKINFEKDKTQKTCFNSTWEKDLKNKEEALFQREKQLKMKEDILEHHTQLYSDIDLKIQGLQLHESIFQKKCEVQEQNILQLQSKANATLSARKQHNSQSQHSDRSSENKQKIGLSLSNKENEVVSIKSKVNLFPPSSLKLVSNENILKPPISSSKYQNQNNISFKTINKK